MHKYRLISKKGEGTFSEVLKAQSIKTGKFVAIKCMKTHFTSIEQVNNLREIQALRRLSPHPHIVKLIEVIYDEPTGRLALVFELMDLNLYEWYKGRKHPIPEAKIKSYMYQLLIALEHMHHTGIFHRDIKPENVLLADDILKLADFGSCRGINTRQPYTEYISTRWYRPPECLLTDGFYNFAMDNWGAGCIFFEVIALSPLFPGKNELDQVRLIHKIMGTPSQAILDDFKKKATHMEINFSKVDGTGFSRLIPNANPQAVDLIQKLLVYNWEERISAHEALKHPYFNELRQQEKTVRLFAVPARSESPSADSAAGSKSKESIYLPPIDNKKLKQIPKIQGPTYSKKNITLDQKSVISKPQFPHWKSPYAAKHFYKSYY